MATAEPPDWAECGAPSGEPSTEALAELRACWEVAALGQFYRVFETEGAPQSVEALEIMLTTGAEEALVGLLPPLLALGADADAGSCWQQVAAVLESVEAVGYVCKSPPTSFAALSAASRGRLLYTLADASLATLARGPDLDPASARGEVLGSDGKGSVYWSLGDRRIYRQSLECAGKGRKKRGAADSRWEVVATSSGGWHSFASTLKKKGTEAALRGALEERVGGVEDEEVKLEKEAKRQALLAGPRRSSDRMQAKEEEEVAKAIAASAKAERLRMVEVIKTALRGMSAELLGEQQRDAEDADEALVRARLPVAVRPIAPNPLPHAASPCARFQDHYRLAAAATYGAHGTQRPLTA